MFAGICVGGWERGVGEVVVFSMGTRLLTAVTEKEDIYKNVLSVLSTYLHSSGSRTGQVKR